MSACNARDLGSIPGSGRSPGEGMAIHSSTLAWKISWTEEPDRLQSNGLQRVGHDWVTSLFFFLSIKRKKTVRNKNAWRLNNMFLNNKQFTEEIKREIKKISRNKWQFLENITTQNLWDVAKLVLRGKFIAIQSYLKNQEKLQIDNLIDT